MIARQVAAVAAVAVALSSCAEPAPDPVGAGAAAGTSGAGAGAGAGGGGASAGESGGGAGATSAGTSGVSGGGTGGGTGGETTAGATSGGTAGTDGGGAGAGTAGADNTPGPSYAETVEPYFASACGPSCHMEGGLGGPPGASGVALSADSSLDLTEGNGYESLTTQASIQVAGMALIGATLEDSYLWHKVNDTYGELGGRGEVMPFGLMPGAAELEAIRAWIEGGAAP